MQTTIPLYGFGGGSGTGATLTLTAPAGAVVTVSKDGKAKTKVAGADGVAVFKGLSTGTWTVTITDGEQTAQKTVTITADYSTFIAFFAATIHVTYPAGSTCTATDGATTLTAPDTSGTWDCVVPNVGTWTVRATDGTNSKSASVSITADGQSKSVTLAYWNGELYDAGNQYTSITGGWSNSGYSYAVPASYITSGPEFGSTGMKLYVPSADYSAVAGTGIKVDLTNAREILVNVSGLDGAMCVIVNGSKVIWDSGMVAVLAISDNGLHSLDVSGLPGSYYIAFAVFGTSSHVVQSATVSEVYLK